MEQSEMEVDPSEVALENNDESCLQAKLSSEELPDIENSLPMNSSSQIEPSSQTVSSEAVPSNQKCTPEVVPSDEITATQAIPSDQTPSSNAIPSDQATSSQVVPSDQAISSQAVPSDQTTSKEVSSDQTAISSEMPPPQSVPSSEANQITSSLPGPSSEVVPLSTQSKMTNGPATKKQRLDYHSMSTGVYLDSTVVPILHLALVTLDRLRPADPVQYVIDFLLRHKAQYSKSKELQAPSSSANQA